MLAKTPEISLTFQRKQIVAYINRNVLLSVGASNQRSLVWFAWFNEWKNSQILVGCLFCLLSKWNAVVGVVDLYMIKLFACLEDGREKERKAI